MNRKRTFQVVIGVISLLLIGSLLYAVLRDPDPYRYFTGLGEEISIAPNDSKIAFSYYIDGEESIYTANTDGSNVERMTNTTNERDSAPIYSPNGQQLAFLSKDQDGIQTLKVMNEDGRDEKELTDSSLHVRDAIFSRDGETIYFVAVEAEEFNKGEMSREGFDLFSIEANGSNLEKLTNRDHFSMNHLSLSADGGTIYYSEFDGKDRIYSYSLEEGMVNRNPAILRKRLATTHSFYEPQLSPSERYLAFTDVSEESWESSLFEYELFLYDLETEEMQRLTDLKKAVNSPKFFHEENKIAFLENTNWAASPAVYELRTIDLTTDEIEAVTLNLPESAGGKVIVKTLDRSVNNVTIAILYMLLLALLSVYFHSYHPRKAYVPSVISFSVAILLFIVSVVVAMMMNPWYGIGLGMLAAAIFACSIPVLLFVFIYRRFAK